MIDFKSSETGRMSKAVAPFAAIALIAGICVSGCAAKTGYNSAFAGNTALVGNSQHYDANPDQIFKSVKITLVQQGFTIEQADAANGLIKGARALQDPKDKKISYLVTTNLDVTGAPSGDATVVTASASQQTVLHKDSEKYFHLLGLVPIPTGKDYQTIVRKEGNITDAGFYKDLFAAIANNLPRPPAVATFAAPAAVATVTPVIPPVPDSAPAGSPVLADRAPISAAPTSDATPASSAPTNTTVMAPTTNP